MILREEGEAASRCVNSSCPARLRETLLHFSARGVMDIDGLGEALVNQLAGRGLVKNRSLQYPQSQGRSKFVHGRFDLVPEEGPDEPVGDQVVCREID